MIYDALLTEDWDRVVERLGGANGLAFSARQTGGIAPMSGHKDGGGFAARHTVLLPGEARAARVRNSGDWLAALVSHLVGAEAPAVAAGRLIRIIDGTSVPQAGPQARKGSKLWRIHSASDLPSERFTHLDVTDEQEGERLDRISVVPGEIRLADRAYLQPDRLAVVLGAGADVIHHALAMGS